VLQHSFELQLNQHYHCLKNQNISSYFVNPFTATIFPSLFACNSLAGCARELFKPFKDLASLAVLIKKN